MVKFMFFVRMFFAPFVCVDFLPPFQLTVDVVLLAFIGLWILFC